MQTNSIEGNDQEITEGRHPATGENETVQPDETRIAIVRLVESGVVRRSQISHETNVSKPQY